MSKRNDFRSLFSASNTEQHKLTIIGPNEDGMMDYIQHDMVEETTKKTLVGPNVSKASSKASSSRKVPAGGVSSLPERPVKQRRTRMQGMDPEWVRHACEFSNSVVEI
jgi:hypothetical protein